MHDWTSAFSVAWYALNIRNFWNFYPLLLTSCQLKDHDVQYCAKILSHPSFL